MNQNHNIELRTDLALEVRESFPEDNVEIQGVAFQEKFFHQKDLRISNVQILNEEGKSRWENQKGNMSL